MVDDDGRYLYSLDLRSIPCTASLDNKGSSAGDMEFRWRRLGNGI